MIWTYDFIVVCRIEIKWLTPKCSCDLLLRTLQGSFDDTKASQAPVHMSNPYGNG